jgi:hypothetical protein
MALLARCSGKHFLLLTGHQRIDFDPAMLESEVPADVQAGAPVARASLS